MELREERRLQFTAGTMVVCIIRLQNLVKPLEEKAPETVQRAKIPYELRGMSSIVVIWTNASSTVKLGEFA